MNIIGELRQKLVKQWCVFYVTYNLQFLGLQQHSVLMNYCMGIAHRKAVRDFGIWNQIRVDKGREWYLMLFVQQKLAHYRRDLSKPAFLQTASTQVNLR